MPVSSPLWCSLWRPARTRAWCDRAVPHDSMQARARASRSRRQLRCSIERLALGPDLDVDDIARDRAGIDGHAEAGRVGQAQHSIRAGHQVIARDLEGERLRLRREFTELMRLET